MKKNIDLYAEILGAYSENKLPKGEMSLVNKVIDSDNSMEELLEEIERISKEEEKNASIHLDFPDFESTFNLPSLDDDEEEENTLSKQ